MSNKSTTDDLAGTVPFAAAQAAKPITRRVPHASSKGWIFRTSAASEMLGSAVLRERRRPFLRKPS